MTALECEEVLAEHERTPPAARTITPWQISASEAFRDGDARSALFAYHERGRVHLCPDDEAALARLVSDWARYEREEPAKSTAVLARTNAERRALSERMREVHLPPSDKRTTLTVLELARFGGHLNTCHIRRCHDAEITYALPTGVPAPDGRVGRNGT